VEPSSDQRWVLALDLGTSGLKAGAVALDGTLLDQAFTPIVTEELPDGGSVQDALVWWSAIADGVREIAERGLVRVDAIAGVGLTGQWGSTVPVDADGVPTAPVMLWTDHRGARHSADVVGGPVAGYAPLPVLRWIRATGGAPSPGGADPTGHALYLKRDRPDVYRRTATLFEPLDYVGFRLTGRRAATPASMVLSWLTDNRPGAPLGYLPELVRAAGRDGDRLPDLVATGSTLGGLLPEVAADLGLPAGVPVVAGVPDLHAAFLGAGTVDDYLGHLTISTSAWISCAVPFKRTDVLRQIASVPGPWAGSYLVIDNHDTGGACLQWFRDRIVDQPPSTEGDLDATPFGTVTDLAATAAPGAGGVIFTPWLKGERSPVDDPHLRAAFLNVSIDTDRADLTRAVMEGVAYNARWLHEAVEKFVKRPLPTLRILGGGAQSDLWCQMHADVMDRRIERPADPLHANLRGAALFAMVHLGLVDRAAIPGLVPIEATFDPDPSLRATYDPLYEEFTKVYGRLNKLYRRLNS
jgi:xylulokinase